MRLALRFAPRQIARNTRFENQFRPVVQADSETATVTGMEFKFDHRTPSP